MLGLRLNNGPCYEDKSRTQANICTYFIPLSIPLVVQLVKHHEACTVMVGTFIMFHTLYSKTGTVSVLYSSVSFFIVFLKMFLEHQILFNLTNTPLVLKILFFRSFIPPPSLQMSARLWMWPKGRVFCMFTCIRGTQRLFSVNYLFGEANIA